jgi:hypothetical protein
MTLKKSFQSLAERLELLRRTTEELLQWAVTQGKPTRVIQGKTVEEDHALASKYYEATVGLTALAEEAVAAACEGLDAVNNQIDLARARRALINCQAGVNQLTQSFFARMVSFEALADLDSLAREQGKWEQWVLGVKDALRQCREPIGEVNQALFELWQEITEQASIPPVSVRAINTVQRITPGEHS